VVSRSRQKKGKSVEVGDIELGNHLEVEIDEQGVMRLGWWLPNDRQRTEIGKYDPGQVAELVKAIRQAPK
jgi:hypothetical protein